MKKNEVYPLYHGGTDIIKEPNVTEGQIDIDFGTGFYMTCDKRMAEKWACSKAASYLKVYSLDISELNLQNSEQISKWLLNEEHRCYGR